MTVANVPTPATMESSEPRYSGDQGGISNNIDLLPTSILVAVLVVVVATLIM